MTPADMIRAGWCGWITPENTTDPGNDELRRHICARIGADPASVPAVRVGTRAITVVHGTWCSNVYQWRTEHPRAVFE